MDTIVWVLSTWYRSNSVEDNLHIIKTNVKTITKCLLEPVSFKCNLCFCFALNLQINDYVLDIH